MKKTMKAIAAVMLSMAMVFAVGCNPEDEPNNGDDNGGGNNGGGDPFNPTYVDLGLPSGTLWATCNIGAETPEGYGDYFAWGETQPKEWYNWDTYKYCHGDNQSLTKYCFNPFFGYNDYVDELTVLEPEDDAATAYWGTDWCMPTKEQWDELWHHTLPTAVTQNGVNGCLFTASNGNSLFLPASGGYWAEELMYKGEDGDYLSSSLHDEEPTSPWCFGFNFAHDECCLYRGNRAFGFPVRPVRSVPQN